MLVRAVRYGTSTACRAHHRTSATTSNALKTVPVLPDTTVTTFRSHALERALPALVPRGSFVDLPAVTKWFVSNANGPSLNHDYLNRFGSIHVPLEVTDLVNGRFARIEQPFSFFLECAHPVPPHTLRTSANLPSHRPLPLRTTPDAYACHGKQQL